jgi:D-tagatose-1,6-bisphosphate aldolase subunit GatZ/KbaZ
MYLDEVRAAQARGVALGVTAVCSAHADVLRETLRLAHLAGVPALIESTCNQVNQFGGYTGMTPAQFAEQVHGLAEECAASADGLLLGGDHLGPSVWRTEPAQAAMQKACDLVREYVRAGFVKLHLDCSMRLEDDAPRGPGPQTIAERAAQLARVAEDCSHGDLRYVIGTEVPSPGGAAADTHELHITAVEDASEAIELHRQAFDKLGLRAVWDRVVAVVVQPGVEFGDDFVSEYQPTEARALSRFIETRALMYEAHSTDYQSPQALRRMVRDHFAILKVGPALTFAYREAVFVLAKIEDQLYPPEERSNLIQVVDQAMVRNPEHWKGYYRGSEAEQAHQRRYSLSDRVRYYWSEAGVQDAVQHLRRNMNAQPVPRAHMEELSPEDKEALTASGLALTFEAVISARISRRLQDYFTACKPG